MGKASRTKRERRDGGTAQVADDTHARRSFPLFWFVIALMVVAGLAALVLTAPDEATKERERAAAGAPAWGEVDVVGDSLSTWSGRGSDSAVGSSVPSISGTGIDGEPIALAADDGTARAYVVMAHWCPHCQAEIPRLVEWTAENELPAGVEIVGVSTAADDGQGNFPPATWLAREDWSYPTMVDDEAGTAADALGVEGFPFFVFVDEDGKVVSRASGELPIDEFEAALEDIAPKA